MLVILFLVELLAQLQFLGQVIFQLVDHVVAAVSLGLHRSQLRDRVLPCHVGVGDGTLNIDVVISLTIYIHLQVVIHLVCIVLVVELCLHFTYGLLNLTHSVHQLTAISVHSIELLENQI